MITYRDVENKVMPPEKRAESKNDFFSFYVGRKISYLMTIPFLYSSIQPNTITWISIMMLIIGFPVFCVASNRTTLLLGWLLFFLWSLFDAIDGNVARYKKQFSKMGDIYDTTGGYAAIALMYFAAGIGAAHNPGILNSILDFKGEILIILGGLSSILGIFPRLIMHKVISSFMDKGVVDGINDKSSYGVIKIIALNISSVTGGSMVFLLLAILLGCMDLYTVCYFVLNLLKMVVSLNSIFRSASRR